MPEFFKTSSSSRVIVFGSTEERRSLCNPFIFVISLTRSSSFSPLLLSYSPILTPVKTISLKPRSTSFSHSTTASLIAIVLERPLAKGIIQNEHPGSLRRHVCVSQLL